MVKTRIIKIIAFVLLGISQIPWLYTLGLSIFNSISGVALPDREAVYGFGAFFGTWAACFYSAFPVYIGAVGLTAASVATAIIAINKDKKQRENSNAKEV